LNKKEEASRDVVKWVTVVTLIVLLLTVLFLPIDLWLAAF
jgi:hypothetical protein